MEEEEREGLLPLLLGGREGEVASMSISVEVMVSKKEVYQALWALLQGRGVEDLLVFLIIIMGWWEVLGLRSWRSACKIPTRRYLMNRAG